MKKIIINIIKRLIYTAIMVSVLVMSLQVYLINQYHGEKIDFTYSKDKKYKGAFVLSKLPNKTPFAILVRTQDNEIIGVESLGFDDTAVQEHLWFYCLGSNAYSKVGKPCFAPTFDIAISLPPTLWERTRAWIAVRIKGLDKIKFEKDCL